MSHLKHVWQMLQQKQADAMSPDVDGFGSCSQALNIPTKINKGTVEITTDCPLVKTGEKVGASEATLLAKLGIKPFSYGLVIQLVRPPAPSRLFC